MDLDEGYTSRNNLHEQNCGFEKIIWRENRLVKYERTEKDAIIS